MKKIKIYQFNPEIYPYKIWVTISNKLGNITDTFVETSLLEMVFIGDDELREASTCFVRTKLYPHYYGSVIVFNSKKYMTLKNIAHEAVHAANQLWSHVGERDTGEEANAYLVGWIAKCIGEVKDGKVSD